MGKRLRELRTVLDIPVSEMAQVTGLDEETYLAHENGSVDFSITFLCNCCKRFGVDIADLVSGANPTLAYYNLTRSNTGMPINRREEFSYQHLAPMLKNRKVEPLRVLAPAQPDDAPISLSTHPGQEFDYIISGRLKLRLDDKVELLNPGDSILYDSSRPHGMIAVGSEDCDFIAIVIPSEKEPALEIQPAAPQKESPARQDDLLYREYMSETLDDAGMLKAVKFHYPDNFNFAYDCIDRLAEKTPDKQALLHISKDKTERRFTFRDISRKSCQAANYLKSLGIKRGDRVMLILKRHYQYWFILPALHRIGAVAVPASNQLQVKDLVYRFKAGDIRAVIHTSDDNIPEYMEEACKSCPNVTVRVVVGHAEYGEHDFNAEFEKFSDVCPRDPAQKARDTSIMFFSSGTTGYPKLIEHSFTYPLGHIITARWWHAVQPDGLHLTISDTGWAKGAWGKIYGQWLCETCLFVYDFDRFHADDIMKLIHKYKVTTFCAPPTMYRFFIREDLSKYDLSNIKHATTAGEALNPEVFNIFKKYTGLSIMEGFGQSESTLILGNLLGMTPRPGSMGKPTPQYDVVLLDNEGKPVETGEVGEICIRTEKHAVCGLFFNYFNDAESTDSTWRDGYCHTGDTAYRDEDGYYWYVGRVDDLIKSSGYRIGPFEVESVMMELPYVLECAVVGVPDPIRGQLVKAFVVLTKDTKPSPELVTEIQEYVKHHTAPYKYPRKVEFLTEMPKTTSGKIRREALRKMY